MSPSNVDEINYEEAKAIQFKKKRKEEEEKRAKEKGKSLNPVLSLDWIPDKKTFMNAWIAPGL